MAGGIDDIDSMAAPANRGILGQDGDAAFLFLVVGVHHPLHLAEAVAEGAGLFQ